MCPQDYASHGRFVPGRFVTICPHFSGRIIHVHFEKIILGTHNPRDASSQGRIIQGWSIQGRIVQGCIVRAPLRTTEGANRSNAELVVPNKIAGLKIMLYHIDE
jgi:hypothetical protein